MTRASLASSSRTLCAATTTLNRLRQLLKNRSGKRSSRITIPELWLMIMMTIAKLRMRSRRSERRRRNSDGALLLMILSSS